MERVYSLDLNIAAFADVAENDVADARMALKDLIDGKRFLVGQINDEDVYLTISVEEVTCFAIARRENDND